MTNNKSVYIIGDPENQGRGLYKGHFGTVVGRNSGNMLNVRVEETCSFGTPLFVVLPMRRVIFLDDDDGDGSNDIPKSVHMSRTDHRCMDDEHGRSDCAATDAGLDCRRRR